MILIKKKFYIINFFFFIETFDVYETRAEMHSSNTVLLNTSFILDSFSKGVLYAFMYIDDNDDIDFSKSVYIPESKIKAASGTFQTVPGGRYRILSFDIESNYHIQSQGFAADVKEYFNITGSSFSGILSMQIMF